MPCSESASTLITAYADVPAFARGQVRDLRIRWALEELGRDYRTELLDVYHPRPDAYREWQPFAQVPAFDDGAQRLFESGAILLYLGEQDERLLPADPATRWQAITWLFAALNSVEPFVAQIGALDIFHAGKSWAAEARPSALKLLESRLAATQDALGERDWLAGTFSVADIVMVTVLRIIDHAPILEAYPTLTAYKARGEDRPAFRRALAEQLESYASPAQSGE
ncbi:MULTISPECIES: glutathione S-transferase family protein [Novosphingobium]|uniref:Glutathione S-transferase family protein n=1 Tax=Novosphingobium pentaromativorans TaxID=205844 RepID=A0A2W5NKD0_9SPHN|nr:MULTISPECIES: glutathione S-transferase family protein [Novosphingobium]PZQ53846.1 MAG: glutathione S-transferase family protein [Novosphingobium pentaromativorans]GFE72755.1 glutathione S-transferase [Novosphingobium sp. TCA1]